MELVNPIVHRWCEEATSDPDRFWAHAAEQLPWFRKWEQVFDEQPVHPDRAFLGREQVRKNWSKIFTGIPDFQAEILGCVAEDDTVWTEWHWYGTHADGTQFNMQGIIIFGVRDDRIRWGRLYMEPVQETGRGIDASVDELTQPLQRR